MRWLFSILSFFAFFSCGCAEKGDAKREFESLEISLENLAGSPQGEWVDRIKYLEEIDLKTPEVRRVRELCVSAYKTFGQAEGSLINAKKSVNLARDLFKNRSDGGLGEVSLARESATKALDEVTEALDRAETRVKECTQSRIRLREELAGKRE